MNNINPMVTSIVQGVMIAQNDTFAWQKSLIEDHIFSPQEAKDLSEREISLIHHALLMQRFSKLDSDELMAQVNKYHLHYHVQFEAEQLQVGAIGY